MGLISSRSIDRALRLNGDLERFSSVGRRKIIHPSISDYLFLNLLVLFIRVDH